MHFADILSFCFSILGLYVLVHYLRFLIPRNLLPHVSAVLAEAEHLRYRAESIGVILQSNVYRSTKLSCLFQQTVTSLIVSYSNQFLSIRMESHRAPGILQQIQLTVQYGLTCKLYTLSSRVVAIKVEIKVR